MDFLPCGDRMGAGSYPLQKHEHTMFANEPLVRTNRGPLPDDILLGDMNGSADSPLTPSFPR